MLFSTHAHSAYQRLLFACRLALLAMLVQALLPTVALTKAAWESRTNPAVWMEVCSVWGTRKILLEQPIDQTATGNEISAKSTDHPNGTFNKLHGKHCPMCTLQGGLALTVNFDWPMVMPQGQAVQVPIISTPRAQSSRWTLAPPRAPPQFS
ncbi:DUF2946 family protein [Ampullimonas aquatilis]|uniref:DUF2946 family protein n=1 Tax=Ampullimonas aquatilis TaxID=1341549 RepID=UPI003C76F60D